MRIRSLESKMKELNLWFVCVWMRVREDLGEGDFQRNRVFCYSNHLFLLF